MEILKNKDLSTKIINHFSNLTELPVKGFLSGGAVANYILELEWGGSYPINDLDVFIEMKYTRNRTTPDRSQELILVNGYNYCGIEYDYNTRYQITDVEVDNLFTQISADATSSYFDVYMNGLEPERYYTILIKTDIAGTVQVFDDQYYFISAILI